MVDREDRNAGIMKEFRTNHGKVGGYFEGRPLLLLTMRGAKSGKQRTTPLAYLADGERFVIFATKGGVPPTPLGTTTSRPTPTSRSKWATGGSRRRHG
jgi:hypothetical protein